MLPSLLLIVFITRHIMSESMCNSINPCTIHCNDILSCNNITINISNRNDFYLNCNESGSCQFVHLYTPQNPAISTNSTSNTSSITIACSADKSCLSSIFDVSNIDGISLSCKQSDSCFSATMNTKNVSNVEINLFDSCSLLFIYCINQRSNVSSIVHSNIFKSSKAIMITSNISTSSCNDQQFMTLQHKIIKPWAVKMDYH